MRGAINRILNFVDGSTNPEDFDRAMVMVIQDVSPEKQPVIIEILKAKKASLSNVTLPHK